MATIIFRSWCVKWGINGSTKNIDDGYNCVFFLHTGSVQKRSEAEDTDQRTHDVITTSLLRQKYVATSFWHNNDVIISSCACWEMAWDTGCDNEDQTGTLEKDCMWTSPPHKHGSFHLEYIFDERRNVNRPADTRSTNNVIMTSKRRCDVVLTSWWRYYCVARPLCCCPQNACSFYMSCMTWIVCRTLVT